MTSRRKGGPRRKMLRDKAAEPYTTTGLDVQAQPVIELQIRVAGDDALQLVSLASRRGLTTEELVRTALEGFLKSSDAVTEAADWQALGLSAFEAAWDNSEDSVYDHWREAYGLGAR